METPINLSIERRSVNMSILLLHQVAEGTVGVVKTIIVKILSGWIL